MARIKTDKNISRKDVIVTKAATLFREKGFKAASMRDLAEAVGVEAASLYNHIKSKTELLHELCFSVANRFLQKIDEVEAEKISAIEKIEKLLRFHINEMIHHYEEVYVSDREWKHLADPYLSNFQNQRRIYRKRFAAIIETGIRNQEVKKIDAPTAVLIMLHAISGIESWHRSTQKISAAELEENMVTILVGGLTQ
ncbi:MAG: TetR/AcrR family transcriptional regulator [Sediminibacterium sp. Gen4]|jgi:TetR/AcrR family transcriptional regulator, cholesterol catabolism regulator|uniref:TetR/AcrR family transcriptional regulator n=1 Tax=unclassified Sediminibacterium TaxID=2635961 RepID=UPI0015BDD182|nr:MULTISPECIES: TetR/AcrR family transcriptional regulator [unclassified Sediminibacterium]MBW0160213.1 TetR/AcrR family transcriptional regulator [Sediminibacterium sp.]MBW0164066.1 TetR/AcrR family transcriptional regulator [Sediminibacterium sp.]NWK66141.1 TetR/AcrR family transcriptional regulator [Sediminibacterium sp. Gen4]